MNMVGTVRLLDLDSVQGYHRLGVLGPHRVAVVEQPAIGRTARLLPVGHEERRWRLAVDVGALGRWRLFANQHVHEVALKTLVDVQVWKYKGPSLVEEVP